MDRDRDVISTVAWCLMVMGLLMPWGVVSASEALPTAGDAERGAILDCVSSSVGVDGYESFDALMASQRAVGCRAALKEIDKPPVSDEQKRAILDEDEAWMLHLRHYNAGEDKPAGQAERSGSATGEQKRFPLMVSPPVERAGDVERVPAQ